MVEAKLRIHEFTASMQYNPTMQLQLLSVRYTYVMTTVSGASPAVTWKRLYVYVYVCMCTCMCV